MRKFTAIGVMLVLLTCVFLTAWGQDPSGSMPGSGDNHPAVVIGGEMRSRIRLFNGINFGDVDSSEHDQDAYINLRGIVSGDFNPGKNFRIYSELITGYTFFKDRISSKDNDILGVGQLFVDLKINRMPVLLRIGRQEFSYGSGRILGTSNGPNVIENFDGIAVNLGFGTVRGSLFYARPVILKEGLFDNTTHADKSLFGSYWSVGMKNDQSLDVYFFGNDLRQIDFMDTTVNEYRFTLGARVSKASGSLFYEAEAAWQSGKSGQQRISAFFAYASAGYAWQHARLHPVLGISSSVYSGDRSSTDKVLNIFRPVRARPPVNIMVPFGPSNILSLIPEGRLSLTGKMDLSLRYYFIWRLTGNDGLYSISMDEMTREPDITGESQGLYITNGYLAQVGYTFNDHFDVTLTSGMYFPGRYIRNTGIGKISRATFLVANYRF